MRHSALVLLLCLGVLPLGAQKSEDTRPTEMSTDRPGLRDSSRVVPVGYLQFETGIQFSVDQEERQNFVRMPGPLVRFGIAPRVELRFLSDGYIRVVDAPGQALQSGRDDMSVGTKIRLIDKDHGPLPHLALIASVSLPAGDPDFTSGGYDPIVSLIWKKNLTETFGIGGVAGWSSRTGEEGRYNQQVFSFSGTKDITDKVTGFAEAYVIQPKEQGLRNQWACNAGLTRQLINNVQVDVAGGRSLHGAPRDWFLSVGLSWRWQLWRSNDPRAERH